MGKSAVDGLGQYFGILSLKMVRMSLKFVAKLQYRVTVKEIDTFNVM